MRLRIFYIASLISIIAFAQEKENKEHKKAIERSKKYTYEGNNSLKAKKQVQAEVDYRNAIAENKDNATAQYNLGTMYYQQKSYGEAFLRLKNAATANGISPEEKHKAFHNLGNTFMKEKAYDKAVDAYKEALRNKPSDEETRYNLAVAKEMLKKNPPPPNNQKDNKNNQQNQNQNNQNNQQNQQNQNNNNNNNQQNQNNQQNKDKKDNKDNKDKKDNNQDKNDKQNQQNKDKGKGDQQKDQNQDPQQRDENSKGEGRPRPSSISPQQMERILEAMNNEERKTQEKVNAQKVKATRSRAEKDW